MKEYKLYNKTYYFDFNVYAQKEIANICPNGKLDNLTKLVSVKDGEGKLYDNLSKILIILNKAGNLTKKFFEDVTDCPVLEEEILFSLKSSDFDNLATIAFACISEGNETEIETKAKKEESSQA